LEIVTGTGLIGEQHFHYFTDSTAMSSEHPVWPPSTD
jgi:hypothetical protein